MTATSQPSIRQRTAASSSGKISARDRQLEPGPLDSPAATRTPDRTFKDPRLLVGVAIVAVCVLLGARLMSAADDTVPVWSVRSDLVAGSSVDLSDLRRQELRFGSPELAARYLSADDVLPEGVVLGRDVSAGELLPRAALETTDAPEMVEIPIALASEAVPSTLRVGERVDVWVTPPAESGKEPRASRVLEQVQVVAAPAAGSTLGPSATRQVVVGLAADDESVLGSALARLSVGSAVIVRRG